MRRHLLSSALALLGLLFGGQLAGAPRQVAAQDEACFAETG